MRSRGIGRSGVDGKSRGCRGLGHGGGVVGGLVVGMSGVMGV